MLHLAHILAVFEFIKKTLTLARQTIVFTGNTTTCLVFGTCTSDMANYTKLKLKNASFFKVSSSEFVFSCNKQIVKRVLHTPTHTKRLHVYFHDKLKYLVPLLRRTNS